MNKYKEDGTECIAGGEDLADSATITNDEYEGEDDDSVPSQQRHTQTEYSREPQRNPREISVAIS